MKELAVSPRKVLIEIRQEIAASARAGRRTTYRRRLGTCRAVKHRPVSRRVVNGHAARPTNLPRPRFSSR